MNCFSYCYNQMDIPEQLPQPILLRIMRYACEYNKRACYNLVNKHWNESLVCIQEILRGDYVYTDMWQKRTDVLCLKKELNSFSRIFICKYLSKQIDPSVKSNFAIQHAARNGHLDVIKYLVELRLIYPDWEPAKRIDPSADDNFAILAAAGCGHLEIVKYLVELRLLYPDWEPAKRIDPSAHNNYAIGWALSKGHQDIVKYLVELHLLYPDWETAKRINPYAYDNYVIQLAARSGHLDTV